MKSLILLGIAATLGGMVSAATFSTGGGQGTSVVDAAGTGDYVSLAQAAADFSSYAPGCTGDWTLLIRSDLTEPNNIAFGNKTNGFGVTVRPAPGTTPVVAFTTTTRPASTDVWDAALCIGTPTVLTTNNVDLLTTTSNFTIDGSNAAGGTSRDLTFTTTNAMTAMSVLCRVVGGCDNVAFRNLAIDNVSSGTQEATCVDFSSRRIGGIDYHPTNCTITNCLLRSRGSAVGVGVMCRSNGGNTAGTAQSGLAVTSNTIEVSCQAVTAVMNSNTTVAHNTLDVFQPFALTPVTTARPQAVTHLANSSAGWTFTCSGNKVLRYGNVNYPFVLPVLTIGLGLGTSQQSTYDITNNFFGGFEYTGTATVTSQQSLRTIQIADGTAAGVYNIYHNSFNNPDVPQINGNPASTGFDRIVPLSMTSANFGGTVNFKNNIVRFKQHNGVVFYRASPNTATFNSDYNDFHIGGTGARMACWNTTSNTAPPTHNTFAAWQAAGFDTHSQTVNPALVNPPATGQWTSNSDLHFTSSPGPLFTGTAVGVALDIDGEARTYPVMGADELSLAVPAAVSDWPLFR